MRRLLSGPEIRERFERNRREVEEVFREDGDVELAYVFGSVGSGEVGELSDIDFAVYLGSEEDLLEKKMELRKKLLDLVGDEMDLVVMNTASRLMNYNIVKGGEVLYQSSATRKAEIESGILREHLDMQYYDRRHVDRKLRKYAEEGFA